MSIVVIGVNHRTSPIEVLERVALGADAVPKATHGLTQRENIREVVVLSTCNRTEVLRRRRTIPRRLCRHPGLLLRARRSLPTTCIPISTASTTTPRSVTCSR
ncbi:MAG: hypothetical protein R2705_07415 [Ilumatobacteraceae bacterium]